MAVKVMPKENMTIFKENTPLYFVLKVPYSKVPRFVELPSHNGTYYLMFLEDIIEANLNYIFPGFDVKNSYTVRVSRDADFCIDFESSQNLVEEIRRHVRKRKIGVANRFVYDNEMSPEFLNYLCDCYGISNERCIPEGRHLHLEDLIKLPNPVGASLTEPSLEPFKD
jgi:Polyphosphate kinase